MGSINSFGGGSSTLQSAYDKSIPPVIVIDGNGAFTLQAKSTIASNAQLIAFKNASGTILAYVQADGIASFKEIVYSPATALDWSWASGLPTGVKDALDKLASQVTANIGNTVKVEEQIISFNSSSPTTIVTLLAGAVVERVVVDITTAFDGASTMSIGISGDIARYMDTPDINLGLVAIFEAQPMIKEVGSVSPIITYTAGSATTGSATITLWWVLPG